MHLRGRYGRRRRDFAPRRDRSCRWHRWCAAALVSAGGAALHIRPARAPAVRAGARPVRRGCRNVRMPRMPRKRERRIGSFVCACATCLPDVLQFNRTGSLAGTFAGARSCLRSSVGRDRRPAKHPRCATRIPLPQPRLHALILEIQLRRPELRESLPSTGRQLGAARTKQLIDLRDPRRSEWVGPSGAFGCRRVEVAWRCRGYAPTVRIEELEPLLPRSSGERVIGRPTMPWP